MHPDAAITKNDVSKFKKKPAALRAFLTTIFL